MSVAFSVSDSLLHICLNSSSCHNVLILLSLSGVTNLSLLVGVFAVWIPWQKALLMCPYVSSGKFSVLALYCSRALLHNLQFTSDHCLIFRKPFGYQNDPCNCHHFSPFMSQGTHGSSQYFPQNALLSFCRNMKSAVHVSYAGWLILPCSALARTHDFKNFLSSIQVFCCKTFTMLWYNSSYRCLCVQSSEVVCRHLYTTLHIVAWVCSFVSKHLLASLHVFAPHSLLPLSVLHPSRYY